MIRMMGLVNLRAIGTPVGSRTAIDELSDAQKKLDVDDDGKIEGEDLAKLRAKKNEQSLDEEEYDYDRDMRAMGGFPRKKEYYPRFTPRPQQKPVAAQQTTAAKTALLQQVVRYSADGKEHEATVKSLLGYPKDHPGRKIAARMYAQFMASQKGQQREEVIPVMNEENLDNQKPSNDHEVSMANNALDIIIQHANDLKMKIGQEEKDIPAWIQDHITNAANFISQAANNYHEHNTPDEVPSPQDAEPMNEKAPEGWEGTVKSMKKYKKIDNPWALAYYMKSKGYKSHKKEK